MHIIDTVLTIPEPVPATAVAAGLSGVAGTLTKANLVDSIDSVSDVTLFAPNKSSFEAIGSALPNLTARELASILQYHGEQSYNPIVQKLADNVPCSRQWHSSLQLHPHERHQRALTSGSQSDHNSWRRRLRLCQQRQSPHPGCSRCQRCRSRHRQCAQSQQHCCDANVYRVCANASLFGSEQCRELGKLDNRHPVCFDGDWRCSDNGAGGYVFYGRRCDK